MLSYFYRSFRSDTDLYEFQNPVIHILFGCKQIVPILKKGSEHFLKTRIKSTPVYFFFLLYGNFEDSLFSVVESFRVKKIICGEYKF